MAGVFKIVVTGPFNSGKTTFIGAISEIDVVSTDRNMTGKATGSKARTTVAMDFGRISLADGMVIHLYGTPGQDRFDFMWEILAEGMIGYVVLVDGSDPGSLHECARIIETFNGISDAPFVVGVTKSDLADNADTKSVEKEFLERQGVRVLDCDARNREDVKTVLLDLLESVLAGADARERAG